MMFHCARMFLVVGIILFGSPACAKPERPKADPDQPHAAAVSHDGRHVAFEFYRTSPYRKHRTKRVIGVYDLNREEIEMHVAPGKREMHSPRFSPDGKFLTFVHFCWEPGCKENEVGTQIALLHLPDRRIRFLTNSKLSIRQTVGRKRHRRVIFGLPSFGPDMSEIYFAYGEGPPTDGVGYGTRPPSKLRFGQAPDLGFVSIRTGATALLGIGNQSQFRIIERLNYYDSRILFTGIGIGSSRNDFDSNELFQFDLTTHNFAAANLPIAPDLGDKIAKPQYRLRNFQISDDGSKIMYTKNSRIHIRTSKEQRSFSYLDRFKKVESGHSMGTASMSGDGSTVVFWQSNNPDHLFVLNTKTGRIDRKPFRNLIHAAIAEHNFHAQPASPPARTRR